MDRTVLQIPVSKDLRAKAEEAAFDYGFSSLQEVIRVFMTKLAKRAIEISFEPVVELTPKASERLGKIDKDFDGGKNTFVARDVRELREQLSR